MEHKVAQGAEGVYAPRLLTRVQFLQPGRYSNVGGPPALLPQEGARGGQLPAPVTHSLVAQSQSLDVGEVGAGLVGPLRRGGDGVVEPAPACAHRAPRVPVTHGARRPCHRKPTTYCMQPNLKLLEIESKGIQSDCIGTVKGILNAARFVLSSREKVKKNKNIGASIVSTERGEEGLLIDR